MPQSWVGRHKVAIVVLAVSLAVVAALVGSAGGGDQPATLVDPAPVRTVAASDEPSSSASSAAKSAADKAAAERAEKARAAAQSAARAKKAREAAARAKAAAVKAAKAKAAKAKAAAATAARERAAAKARAAHAAKARAAKKRAAARAKARQAADCTPGYSPCLPVASDYDCAGGSGNGPKYVYGTVKVTGGDPYGLDSDRDGIGCE